MNPERGADLGHSRLIHTCKLCVFIKIADGYQNVVYEMMEFIGFCKEAIFKKSLTFPSALRIPPPVAAELPSDSPTKIGHQF